MRSACLAAALVVLAACSREFADRTVLASDRHERADVLSVMNLNTFLLEVRVAGQQVVGKPDMEARSKGLGTWFSNMHDDDVPDVLVLNEIMSKAGCQLVQKLCHDNWTPGTTGFDIVQCEDTSEKKFGYATRVLNPNKWSKISGGVVILARKGLKLSDFYEEEFAHSSGADTWSRKGFLRVKVTHPSVGEVYIIGTHTQAWADNSRIRQEQFNAIWMHILSTLEGKVIVAGDLNAEESELQMMHSLLHARYVPLEEKGFWLPLRTPLKYSTYAGGGQNAYLHYDPAESHAKSPHDQILWIDGQRGANDSVEVRWQYLPVKSEECFESKIASRKKTIWIDDLSDHHAAYAEFCFGGPGHRCAPRVLLGNRGFSRVGREQEARCCPGRGLYDGKCFDWAEGGIKGGRDRIFPALSPAPWPHDKQTQFCMKFTRGKWCAIADEKGDRLVTTVGASGEVDENACLSALAKVDLPFGQLKCGKGKSKK